MDRLLRAAIQRRYYENETLAALDEDQSAKLRCVLCGAVLVEEPVSLRCSECIDKHGRSLKRRYDEWAEYHERRRQMLERVANQVDEKLKEMDMAQCKRPGCSRMVRSDNKNGVCSVRSKCESPTIPPRNSATPVVAPLEIDREAFLAAAAPVLDDLTPPPQIRPAPAIPGMNARARRAFDLAVRINALESERQVLLEEFCRLTAFETVAAEAAE